MPESSASPICAWRSSSLFLENSSKLPGGLTRAAFVDWKLPGTRLCVGGNAGGGGLPARFWSHATSAGSSLEPL